MFCPLSLLFHQCYSLSCDRWMDIGPIEGRSCLVLREEQKKSSFNDTIIECGRVLPFHYILDNSLLDFVYSAVLRKRDVSARHLARFVMTWAHWPHLSNCGQTHLIPGLVNRRQKGHLPGKTVVVAPKTNNQHILRRWKDVTIQSHQ